MLSTSHFDPDQLISKFVVVGIGYRHADVSTRSLFSVSPSNCQLILEAAKRNDVKSLFVLSTCNRTEIYAYCYDHEMLIELLVQHTKGTRAIFDDYGYLKSGTTAIQHLYNVAAGLDSQIIGDFEVLGQLKSAVTLSRKHEMIGPVMDRTVNFALQASKSVKTNTRLSTGTVSVSYAAIEWLKKEVGPAGKSILLLGTGKFGRILAKNLTHYFPNAAITVMNRTDEVAMSLAESLSIGWKPYSLLKDEVKIADIIIVCTNADEYTLLPKFFDGEKSHWIMDLSVPETVHPDVRSIPGISLTCIDEISQAMESTIEKRNSEIPKAISILEQHHREFLDWLEMQRHVPAIYNIKNKLYTLGESHFSDIHDKRIINSKVNRAIGSLAMNLRYKKEKGCHYINAINEFLKLDAAHG